MIATTANLGVRSESNRTWREALWAGRALSGLAVLFLLFDAALKVLKLPLAVEATTQLGYPGSVLIPLGVIELVCLIVYLIPRTAALGAVLWTDYLGGAIATHVRVGSPLFTHTLFPITSRRSCGWGCCCATQRLRQVFFSSPR